MTSDSLVNLNRAFVRIYRSYGQYLHSASPEFDSATAAVVGPLITRQASDAERLGRHLVREQGNVLLGNFPMEFGKLHFLDARFLIPDWIEHQKTLIAELETDRSAIDGAVDSAGLELLDEALTHERDSLTQLEKLKVIATPSSPAPA